MDASKTVFIDQSHVLVVTSRAYYAMKIIPKDSFGNMCSISQEHLTAEIRKVCMYCVYSISQEHLTAEIRKVCMYCVYSISQEHLTAGIRKVCMYLASHKSIFEHCMIAGHEQFTVDICT